MQLPEVDPFYFQPAQAHLDLLGQVLRASDGQPLIWALARKAAFGCDDDALCVGSQCLADELFAYVRTVGVGSVDEVDAEFDDVSQNFLGAFDIFGLAPDPVAGDPHCPVSHAIDGEIPAN